MSTEINSDKPTDYCPTDKYLRNPYSGNISEFDITRDQDGKKICENELAISTQNSVPEQVFANAAAQMGGTGRVVSAQEVEKLAGVLKSKLDKNGKASLERFYDTGDTNIYQAAVAAAREGDTDRENVVTKKEIDDMAKKVIDDIKKIGTNGKFTLPGVVRC